VKFDLTTVLGRSVRDAQLRVLCEFCEEQPVPTERAPELDDGYYLEFPRSGFSLLLTGNDIVETVHIRTRSDGEYHAFFDALPFALTADTTQMRARELFGLPSRWGGPVRPVLDSEPVVYWDRWDYHHHSFHLEYSEERDCILLITLSSIPASTTNKPTDA
jgi:hypothetical protein